jgi:23S rRNA (adenine2503-C2)-methyltransferase
MVMEIVAKIKSQLGNVTKYVFKMRDGLITEFSYIDKDDGKDIICVPTQTLCAQGCKFCHVTGHIGKLKFRNIGSVEIVQGIKLILADLGYKITKKEKGECLLISYMGCGEPLDNVDNVKDSMRLIRDSWYNHFKTVRFAIATMIPKNRWDKFFDLCGFVKENKYQVKIHLSLHYTEDQLRWKWMPNALDIDSAILSIKWAMDHCGIKGEIHYALMTMINDDYVDFLTLCTYEIPVKFLFYNEKDTVDAHASTIARYEIAKKVFDGRGLECEYYVPPGLDIGASCGQFLLDYYEKYNGVVSNGQ